MLQIYTNSWAIHHDEQVYSDPMSYNPDRFLDTDGKILPQEHAVRKRLVFNCCVYCISNTFGKSEVFYINN